jgi:hypothetical protein
MRRLCRPRRGVLHSAAYRTHPRASAHSALAVRPPCWSAAGERLLRWRRPGSGRDDQKDDSQTHTGNPGGPMTATQAVP